MASPNPNNFVHGKNGKLIVGSTEFVVQSFTFKGSSALDDITHTGAAGYQVMLAGIESAEVTIKATYDLGNKPTVAPQNFKVGQSVTLHAKPDGSDDFIVPVIISDFSFDSGPKAGAVIVNITGKSSGAITYPAS